MTAVVKSVNLWKKGSEWGLMLLLALVTTDAKQEIRSKHMSGKGSIISPVDGLIPQYSFFLPTSSSSSYYLSLPFISIRFSRQWDDGEYKIISIVSIELSKLIYKSIESNSTGKEREKIVFNNLISNLNDR